MIALVLFIFIFPLLVKSSYIMNIAVLVGIYSIVAIGLNLLTGNTGQISLGHAGFFGIGAYISGLISVNLGINFWISMPVATLFSGIAGYIVGATSIRLRHAYLAMATVAFGIIFYVVVNEWNDITGGAGGFGGIPVPSLSGFSFNTDRRYFYLVWISVLLIFYFSKNLSLSKAGRAMLAIKENQVSASVMGIDIVRYKLKVFVLSALYAGFAGSLFAHYTGHISPNSFSITFSITLLSMLVVGGMGNVWGGIIGSGVIIILPEFLRMIASFKILSPPIRILLSDYSYHLIMYGIFTYLFVLFFPLGISGWIFRSYILLRQRYKYSGHN